MDVREQILAAFAETPRPRMKGISVETYDDEDTERFFKIKQWRSLRAKELREHSSALSFFTPEAFRYFLPAFMLAEIDDAETADIIAGSIAFHFNCGHFAGERKPKSTAAELKAIDAFFELCCERYGDGYKDEFSKAGKLVQRWCAETHSTS